MVLMMCISTLVLSSGSSIEKGESLLDTGYTLRAVGADVIVIRHPQAGAGQRRRRYYRLTPAGAGVLTSQRSTWREFAEAISRIAGVEGA